MPCLHDEPYARLETVRRMLTSVRGCLFNAPAEERLARRLATVREGGVVGMGFDPPAGEPAVRFAEPRGVGPYVLYAGRIEEGKRVDVLVDYALRHARESAAAPKLVLIGSGTYSPPEDAAEVVVHAGLLGEEEQRAAYAEAIALVNPSELESLSIVLMEAWLEGTPALVADGSEVMREHAAASESYRDGLQRLLDDPGLARRMGEAGRAYVLDSYGWTAVRQRLSEALDRLVA